MAEEHTKIKLKDVKVIFANLEDTGFGKSITIDCTDKAVEDQIVEWVKTNNIGKDNPGVANIKDYTSEKTGETTRQFAFRINDYTKFAGVNGLSEKDLGYGARVDLIANSFTYNNKFTGGKERVGQSLSAVVVRAGASTGADADLADLLGDEADTEAATEVSGVPF